MSRCEKLASPVVEEENPETTLQNVFAKTVWKNCGKLAGPAAIVVRLPAEPLPLRTEDLSDPTPTGMTADLAPAADRKVLVPKVAVTIDDRPVRAGDQMPVAAGTADDQALAVLTLDAAAKVADPASAAGEAALAVEIAVRVVAADSAAP